MSQKKRKIGKAQQVEEKKYFGLDKKQRSRLYTIIFFIVVGILFIINNSTDDTKPGPYPPNYKQTSNDILELSSLKGKVVLVDFWATWCPPCRRSIPDLVMLKNEFKDKDFEIVGISLDAITRGGATASDVVPFMNAYKINYPIVQGDESVVNSFGGLQSIPTMFLVDKDGTAVVKYEGIASKEDLKKNIEKILGNNYDKRNRIATPSFKLPIIK